MSSKERSRCTSSKRRARCRDNPRRCVETKAGPQRYWTEEHKNRKEGNRDQDTRRSIRGVPITSYINNLITTGSTGAGLRAQLPTHEPTHKDTTGKLCRKHVGFLHEQSCPCNPNEDRRHEIENGCGSQSKRTSSSPKSEPPSQASLPTFISQEGGSLAFGPFFPL